MSATQPNLGSGVRRLAALSCGFGLIGLTACGSTGLPAGLAATSSDGQRTDTGVLTPAAGRAVPPSGGAAGRIGSTPVGPPTGAGVPAVPPPPRDAGAGTTADGGFGDGGLPFDGGRPTPTDAGFIMDAGVTCSSGVYPGDLSIWDARGLMLLRGCKEISGSLTINADNIEDLSDLQALTTVRGVLQIGGFSAGVDSSSMKGLKSLKGLEGLRSVGSLVLNGLGAVTTLEPLSGLTSAFEVNFVHLDALTKLDGLGQLEWQSLSLASNAQLQSLAGLKVPEKASMVELLSSPMLSDIKGLAPLHMVSQLDLRQLPALKSVDGLQGIQSGYERLSITECTALEDLTGLGAFGLNIEITNNAALRSLAGPAQPQQLLSAMISNNPLLSSLGNLVPAMQDSLLPEIVLERLPSLKSLADLKALRQASGLGIMTCDGLKDLTGLEALTTVAQIGFFDCAGLVTLKGLDALENIELLHLDGLPSLTSMQGMPKLQRLNSLFVFNTNSLPSLQGLELLTTLSSIELNSNLALTSLHGLEKVTEIGQLGISGNTALPNLMGLTAVQTIGILQVSGNPALKNLQGSALKMAEQIALEGNAALADLTGLENLTTVASTFSITQNQSLINLRALTMLKSVNGGMFVEENRRLPECEVELLGKRLGQQLSMGVNGPPGMCPP